MEQALNLGGWLVLIILGLGIIILLTEGFKSLAHKWHRIQRAAGEETVYTQSDMEAYAQEKVKSAVAKATAKPA